MPQTYPIIPFQRVTLQPRPKAELVASCCPTCGRLVAASPNVSLLQFVETIHVCPQFGVGPLPMPSTQI
jgi:hypothetical protein